MVSPVTIRICQFPTIAETLFEPLLWKHELQNEMLRTFSSLPSSRPRKYQAGTGKQKLIYSSINTSALRSTTLWRQDSTTTSSSTEELVWASMRPCWLVRTVLPGDSVFQLLPPIEYISFLAHCFLCTVGTCVRSHLLIYLSSEDLFKWGNPMSSKKQNYHYGYDWAHWRQCFYINVLIIREAWSSSSFMIIPSHCTLATFCTIVIDSSQYDAFHQQFLSHFGYHFFRHPGSTCTNAWLWRSCSRSGEDSSLKEQCSGFGCLANCWWRH